VTTYINQTETESPSRSDSAPLHKTKHPDSFGCLVLHIGELLSALGGELLLQLIELLLGSLLILVPAFFAHLLIDGVLHAEGVVEGSGKSLMHIGSSGLNASVHIKVAGTFGDIHKIFHYTFVVHFSASSLYQRVELIEKLLIFINKLLSLLLQGGVLKLICSFAALLGEELSVRECVLKIHYFFGSHKIITSGSVCPKWGKICFEKSFTEMNIYPKKRIS